MMKARTEPHRVYTRNDVVHVCFNGAYFGPGKAGTRLKTDREVQVEELDAVGGRKRVAVKQRVGKRTLREVWRATNVPVHHREATQEA